MNVRHSSLHIAFGLSEHHVFIPALHLPQTVRKARFALRPCVLRAASPFDAMLLVIHHEDVPRDPTGDTRYDNYYTFTHRPQASSHRIP